MSDRRPVLLTVSGVIPADLNEQVGAGRRPRADYAVMSEEFEADLVDVPIALAATGRIGRVLHRLSGPGGLLAWYCFRSRKRYEVIVTDGEQAGIPLALLCRVFGRGSARHMMIVHVLSTASKVRVISSFRLARLIDRYVVYCSFQRDFIVERFGVPADHVLLSTFMVDTSFFDLALVDVPQERMICTAGLERRDYPTLMAAVDGLDVRVVIAAASPWSTQADSTTGRAVPPNVEICRLNLFELRELYARSLFVVMPLVEVDFQAGITTILEAMSMERLVVCTRTAGQIDTIHDGVTGAYVAAGDSMNLRRSIERFINDPDLTRQVGHRARDWVAESAEITVYARRMGAVVRQLRQPT